MFYYRDCYSRMSSPFPKPIPSVTHCIELLKVASQIQYQDVVDVGMKYLAEVSWSGDDEKQVPDFCNSGHFASNTASDLEARLDFPLIVNEERHVNYSILAKKALSRHLEFALCPHLTGWESPTCCESITEVLDHRKLFADAFHAIMTEAESNRCHNLREYVMTLVKEESEKVFGSVKNDPLDENFGEEVSKFCWLYELSRGENVSQYLVELILNNEKVDMKLMSADREAQYKWAGMICHIFEDLVEGHSLFLSTLERYTLFSDWKWMFIDEYMIDAGYVGTDLVEFITNIVMTFPPLELEQIYLTWVVTSGNNRILAKFYSTWVTHLIREAVKREPNFEGEGTSAEKASSPCSNNHGRMELGSCT